MSRLRKITVVVAVFFSVAGFDNPIKVKISEIVEGLDYIVIDASSNEFKPGVFLFRENYIPDRAVSSSGSLRFLCKPKFPSGFELPAPINTNLWPGLFGSSIVLDKKFVKAQLGMPQTSDYSTSVRIRFVDQRTVQYSKEQLDEIRKNIGPACAGYLNGNISTQNAYQVRAVYEMRLQYEVEYYPNLDAGVKKKIIRELANIGSPISEIDQSVVKGEISVYGLKWCPLWQGASVGTGC